MRSPSRLDAASCQFHIAPVPLPRGTTLGFPASTEQRRNTGSSNAHLTARTGYVQYGRLPPLLKRAPITAYGVAAVFVQLRAEVLRVATAARCNHAMEKQ